MQISRLFRLLYILLERERVPAPELAQTLEVSVRTIYRDVQTLSEAGIPVYAERGRDGGVAILPTFRLNKSMVSAAEKQDMLAALQAFSSTGASDRETLGKLSAFFGGRQADWVRIDFADWSGTRDGLIPVLKAAILNRRMLAFDYYNSGGVCAPREVCPVRLWFKSSAWYLLAYCMQKRAMRTFKLTRIKRLRAIDGAFPDEALTCAAIEPPNIEPDTPPIRFTLRIDAGLAFRVYDDFEEKQIAQTAEGDFLVRAAFMPGEWLISFILSYGAHARVIEPKALADAVSCELEKMSAQYKT